MNLVLRDVLSLLFILLIVLAMSIRIYVYLHSHKKEDLSAPIEMLQTELNILQRAKDKSIESYNKGLLNLETHKIHMTNLEPKIIQFESAIKKLNK